MPRKKRCKVFVSYSRHDEELVKPLAGLLGAAANDAVFLDVTSLKSGRAVEGGDRKRPAGGSSLCPLLALRKPEVDVR
jgi:hypothetical protein